MALDSPKLHKVLEDVMTGVIQLPDFQRDWKWDDQRIRELIATVTLDYPLGVVMTLETGGQSPFRARPLTGAEDVEGVVPGLLLLDGQQRLTSLFQALNLDRPVRTTDDRGKELRRWYYVDIVKAVRSPADRDEAIVSVPEDRVLRSDFARRVDLDVSSTELECRARHFPLSQVFDTDKVTAWQKAFVMSDDSNWALWSEFQEQILNNVRAFQIPMIRLSKETSKDAVCSVFERVNTGGVPLNVFELLTATYAGDRDYELRHGNYYRLPDVWHDIKKRLATTYPVFGQGPGDGLSSSDFLQAVALVHTFERRQERRSGTHAPAVSCKRRDLLSLPLADFDRIAPRMADAFEWVGEFLNRQCIVRFNDLPYRTQLVPLAAVRTVLGERMDEPATLDLITRWYWCGVLGEMYGGSTESRFTRDVEQLIAWVHGSDKTPDTITEAAFLSDRLDTLTTRNSAAYKGIFALLIKQGAVDWHHADDVMTPATMIENLVDIHHVFPRPWFARNVGNDKRANSIVNKTPLSYRATRSMTGSPGTYLAVLAREAGTRPEWFDDVVATHLIDPATLHHNDFEKFYADRSERLVELVNEAMGKRTVYRDMSDR